MTKNRPGKWILILLLFLTAGSVYLMETGGGREEPVIITRDTYESGSEVAAPARILTEASLPIENVVSSEAADPRVSLNEADKKQLMTLPMIGEVRARAIIDYRNEYGPFSDIADIMKVSGIGKGIFERIKDKIRV